MSVVVAPRAINVVICCSVGQAVGVDDDRRNFRGRGRLDHHGDLIDRPVDVAQTGGVAHEPLAATRSDTCSGSTVTVPRDTGRGLEHGDHQPHRYGDTEIGGETLIGRQLTQPCGGLLVDRYQFTRRVEDHQPGLFADNSSITRLKPPGRGCATPRQAARPARPRIGLPTGEWRLALPSKQGNRAPRRVTDTQHGPQLVVEAERSQEVPVPGAAARVPSGGPQCTGGDVGAARSRNRLTSSSTNSRRQFSEHWAALTPSRSSTLVGPVGSPVPGSVVTHTAASNGTIRRNLVDAAANTSVTSAACPARHNSSSRRRRAAARSADFVITTSVPVPAPRDTPSFG